MHQHTPVATTINQLHNARDIANSFNQNQSKWRKVRQLQSGHVARDLLSHTSQFDIVLNATTRSKNDELGLIFKNGWWRTSLAPRTVSEDWTEFFQIIQRGLTICVFIYVLTLQCTLSETYKLILFGLDYTSNGSSAHVRLSQLQASDTFTGSDLSWLNMTTHIHEGLNRTNAKVLALLP